MYVACAAVMQKSLLQWAAVTEEPSRTDSQATFGNRLAQVAKAKAEAAAEAEARANRLEIKARAQVPLPFATVCEAADVLLGLALFGAGPQTVGDCTQ